MAGAAIGALRIDLGASTANFEAGMTRAQAIARRTGRDLETSFSRTRSAAEGAFAGISRAAASLGVALSVGAIAGVVRSFTNFADDLSTAADQAGIAVERYQTLREALRALEVDGASADKVFRKLETTLGDVQNGVENSATAALDRLGIRARILNGEITTTDGLLDALAESSRRTANQAQFTSEVVAILGQRVGPQLAAALRDGGEALHRLEQAMRESGTVIDEAMIQRLADANERWDHFVESLQRGSVIAFGALADFFSRTSEGLSGWISDVGNAAAAWIGFTNTVSATPGLPAGTVGASGTIQNTDILAGNIRTWARRNGGTVGNWLFPDRPSDSGALIDRSSAEESAWLARLRATRTTTRPPVTTRPGRGGGGGRRSGSTATRQRSPSELREDAYNAAYSETMAVPSFVRDGTLDALNRGLGEANSLSVDLVGTIANLGETIGPLPDLGNMLTIEDQERIERFQHDFQRDLSSSLADAIVSGKSLGDALVDSFKRAAAALLDSAIFDLLSGRGLGGKGGFFSSLGSIFGGLFGGKRAKGGPVRPGKGYLVGEEGPELFMPRMAGIIVPRHALNGPAISRTDLSPARLADREAGEGRSETRLIVEPSPLFSVVLQRTEDRAAARGAVGGTVGATTEIAKRAQWRMGR